MLDVSQVQTVLCHPDGAYLMVSPTLWNDAQYVVTHRLRHDFVPMPESMRADLAKRFEDCGGLPEWPGEYVDTLGS